MHTPAEDGRLTGYRVLRPGATGAEIVPLVTAIETDADLLFRALVTEAPPEPAFIDPPEPNRLALRLAGGLGPAPAFKTARMYRGRAARLPPTRIFGITSFELG